LAQRVHIANSYRFIATVLRLPAHTRVESWHHRELIARMAPKLRSFPINRSSFPLRAQSRSETLPTTPESFDRVESVAAALRRNRYGRPVIASWAIARSMRHGFLVRCDGLNFYGGFK
jgi:hypothetical protein